MKRLVVFSMTILFAASALMGQAMNTGQTGMKQTTKSAKIKKTDLKKLNGNAVGDQAKLSFLTDFGNVPGVQWRRDNFFDEASFTQNGQKMTAFYDIEGKLVGTTSVKTFASLPDKAQKEINDKYKSYKTDAVIFYDDNTSNDTDMYLYGSQFDDEDNYFVEMSKGTSRIVLMVSPDGVVSFFKQMN